MILPPVFKKRNTLQRRPILGRFLQFPLLVGSFFVLFATTTLTSSCSKLHKQSSGTGAPLDNSIEFCSLLRTPENYDSKTIRVRSTLIGYHQLAFYSNSCDSKIRYIRADTDSRARKQLVEGAAKLDGAGMKDGNFWVEIVAVGRFEKIPESDCKTLIKESGMPGRFYVNFCYRIAIDDIERVDPAPKSIDWPD